MAGTAAGASYLQWRYGNIDFRMGFTLLIGSWLGGGSGVYLANVLVRGGQFGSAVTFLPHLLRIHRHARGMPNGYLILDFLLKATDTMFAVLLSQFSLRAALR